MASRTSVSSRQSVDWPRLVLISLALLGFVAALPGCGGCTQDPVAAKKKKDEQEKEKEKKKKKKKDEKPKPNFEPVLVRMLPSNDPSATRKEPAKIFTKPGHWIAVSETTKANNFDFVGELSTYPEAKVVGTPLELENTNSRLSILRPASLPKGQSKTFESLFFIPRRITAAGDRYSLKSELRAPRGGGMQIETSVISSALKEHEFMIVVLASNPAAYTHLDKLHSVYMPNVSVSDNETLHYYYVVRPNVEKRAQLPSHPLAWTTVAFLIWDDVNPAVLTEEQQQALLDWVHWGGQLVISGPNSLDKLKGTFLSPYLPADSKETIKLEQAAFDELNDKFSLVGVKPTTKDTKLRRINILAERPMVGVEFKPHAEGRDVPGTGGLVVERRVGGGRILVTAFPLTDVRIKQWKNFDGFFNNVVLRRPARSFSNGEYGTLQVNWQDPQFNSMLVEPRLGSTVRYFTRDVGFLTDDRRSVPIPTQPMAGTGAADPFGVVPPGVAPGAVPAAIMAQYSPAPPLPDTSGMHPDLDDWHFNGYDKSPQSGIAAWNDYGAASEAARTALTEAAGIEIPKAQFVFQVLAAYLLVLVPLNWFIFWMLGRVEWAWIAAPIIAIVGAGAVIRLAQLDIGFARSRTEIAVLEVQGGYERAHLTRYSALYTSLSSSYRLSFAENSALALPFASPPGTNRQEIANIADVIYRRDKDTSLSGVQVSSNSTGMVHSEQMFSLEGKLTLVGDAQKGYTVKNTGNLTLHDVGILRKTATGQIETAYVAKLTDGTSSPLSFAPLPIPQPEKTEDGKWKPLPPLKPWLPEWDKSPVFSTENPDDPDSKGRVRLARLARLAAQRLRLNPGDFRLVAWTDQPLSGLAINPDAPQNNTYTLVVGHLVRGDLPQVTPDNNVAEDYYEPEIDPETGEEVMPPTIDATSGS